MEEAKGLRGVKKMIAMLAILGLVMLAYDSYLVYRGEVNLGRHVPFLVPIATGLVIAGLIKLNRHWS